MYLCFSLQNLLTSSMWTSTFNALPLCYYKMHAPQTINMESKGTWRDIYILSWLQLPIRIRDRCSQHWIPQTISKSALASVNPSCNNFADKREQQQEQTVCLYLRCLFRFQCAGCVSISRQDKHDDVFLISITVVLFRTLVRVTQRTIQVHTSVFMCSYVWFCLWNLVNPK